MHILFDLSHLVRAAIREVEHDLCEMGHLAHIANEEA